MFAFILTTDERLIIKLDNIFSVHILILDYVILIFVILLIFFADNWAT